MSTNVWNLDLSHSSVTFAVRHMVISKVRGKFGKFGGAIRLDPDDLARSTVDLTIDAASIDTGIADRDSHLRSPDFLDAEGFPAITYKSKRVQKVSSSTYELIGDLTIRGVTREVPLHVEFGGRAKDPWGSERAGFTATAHLDRKEFGLTWNQVLEAGGVLVGEKVEIDIEVELVKAAAEKAA